MVTLPYGARSSKLELIKHQLFLWCLKIFFSHESKEAAKTVSFGAVWLNKKSITQPHTLSCFKSSQVGHFWSTHTCVSVSKHWNRYYHYTTFKLRLESLCSDLSNNSTLIFHVVGMPIHQAYYFLQYVENDLKMLLNYFLMEHLGLDLCKKQQYSITSFLTLASFLSHVYS